MPSDAAKVLLCYQEARTDPAFALIPTMPSFAVTSNGFDDGEGRLNSVGAGQVHSQLLRRVSTVKSNPRFISSPSSSPSSRRGQCPTQRRSADLETVSHPPAAPRTSSFPVGVPTIVSAHAAGFEEVFAQRALLQPAGFGERAHRLAVLSGG